MGEAAGGTASDRQRDSASGGTSPANGHRHPEGSAPDEGSADHASADDAEHEAHDAHDAADEPHADVGEPVASYERPAKAEGPNPRPRPRWQRALAITETREIPKRNLA